MALTKNDTKVTPEDPQNERVSPGSPLAIIGLFVELIRKRFSADSGLPWVYDPDIKKTKVAIESAFIDNAEHRNFRPAIYVDKEDSVIGRTVLGDRVGYVNTSTQDVFWGPMTVPITIECISTKRGESAILGDIVQHYLHASSDLIQSHFNLHEMTPVTLQQTKPFETDDTLWVSAITFTIQFDVRWTHTPIRPILQQIKLDIQKSGAESATEYFESLILSDVSPGDSGS